MLKSTRQLIAYLEQTSSQRENIFTNSYVNPILQFGDKEDIEAVFQFYKAHPKDRDSQVLTEILMMAESNHYAQQLFELAVENDRLKEGIDESILALLGKFQVEASKPALIHYAFESEDHYLSKSAVKGLLYFDCHELQDRIRQEIESTYEKGLFLEYVPALVCKLDEQDEALERLYDTGKHYCSSDCNAGILLGFSLCGAKGYPYFWNAIWDAQWEASDSGTGTVWVVYEGMQNLGIRFDQLYAEIKNEEDEEKIEQGVDLILSLLRCRINDYKRQVNTESFAGLYQLLFGWEDENHGNDLADLARQVEWEDEAYKLRDLLELRVNEEVLLRNFR